MRRTTTITTTVFAASFAIGMSVWFANKHILNDGQQTDVSTPMDDLVTAETITSAEHFDAAIRRDNVILHLDVDWAIQAIQSRPVTASFRRTIEANPKYREIVFRRIDCTEQNGAVWEALVTWLYEQNADASLLAGGNGAIVWVKSGKIVETVPCAAREGVNRLVSITEVVMPNKAVNPSGGSGEF